MKTGRILALGSENWVSKDRIICGLSDASARIPRHLKITFVRNSFANGAAKIVGDVANDWVRAWPGQYNDPILLPPGSDITDNIDLCVTFYDGRLSALAEHEVGLVKAAGIEIMDYSTTDTTEEAA